LSVGHLSRFIIKVVAEEHQRVQYEAK